MLKIIITLILILTPQVILAQTVAYTPLEEIPFAGSGSYFGNLYNFIIGIVGISALLMITIGGIWYVTSAGNQARAQTAKTIITDALLGLLVVLFAWVILNTVNPFLTSGQMSVLEPLKSDGTLFGSENPWCITTPTGSGSCYKTQQECENNKRSIDSCGNITPNYCLASLPTACFSKELCETVAQAQTPPTTCLQK